MDERGLKKLGNHIISKNWVRSRIYSSDHIQGGGWAGGKEASPGQKVPPVEGSHSKSSTLRLRHHTRR